MIKNHIPKSWESICLGNITHITYGKGLPTKHLLSSGFPVFGANGIIGFYDRYLYEDSQLLISCRGASSGEINFSPPKCFVTNNSLIVDFLFQAKILRKTFYYFLQAVKKDRLVTGSAQPQVTINNAIELKLNLPPLNEQKRIVSKIEELFSELDNGIASLKTAREQLKVYRQAVLKHAFESKLTAKWREENADKLESPEQLLARIQQEREARYQEQLEDWKAAVKEWEINGKKGKNPNKPRKQKIDPIGKSDLDDLFDIPEKWKWVFLNELSEYIVDGTHHTPDYTDSGVPFISAKDIRDFKINFEKARFISDLQHKDLIKRCRPRKNSVLLTKSGTIGRVALVDIDFEFSLFESVSNIPILGNLQGRFVMWAVYFQVSTYFGAKNQKGVAIRHLHLEDIRRLPVPLPSYNEQTVFVEKIENIFNRISENEAVIDAELLHAETLRQSILKKAFSGQLVPQDPSDEPASELLARIQAEKEFVNTQKTKKTNKKQSVSGH